MEYTTPSGFRDVLADEAIAREAIARRVQDLFASRGYLPIETPTLESMAVMQAGGRVPASPFKFFDATGDLVTMRPDVTLQVARMCATRLGDAGAEGASGAACASGKAGVPGTAGASGAGGASGAACASGKAGASGTVRTSGDAGASGKEGPYRFRYMQRVFRETEGQLRADVREKKQIGIECIGVAGAEADAEVIGLFAQALETAGVRDFKLSLATVGVLRSLLAASTAPDAWKASLLEAFHTSNFVEIDSLCDCAQAKGSQFAPVIRALARIRGGREAIRQARELVVPLGCADALDGFEAAYDLLAADGLADRIVIDFSVMSSFDYYTGIVFEAFAPGLGTPLGSGGRYDKLLATYGVDRPAAGFAFYLEEAMEAAAAQDARAQAPGARPLRVAVPKGSLNADTIEALAAAGLDVSGLEDPGRSLIISNPGVDYIIVRPSDAPVFVETGAADCGICGEDSLLEAGSDVVELADLRFGACRFIVAEPQGAAERTAAHYRQLGSIRVATKYPRIARAHFARRGTQVEIVQLHGNIELGPLTGMSECIVDITATGTTLRENNLVVTDEVLSSTARFFGNVASFRTDARVRDLAERLRVWAADRDLKVTAGGAGK